MPTRGGEYNGTGIYFKKLKKGEAQKKYERIREK